MVNRQVAQEGPKGLSKSDLALGGTLIQKFGTDGYDVADPPTPFLIVDKKGTIRVSIDADATPADFVTNIRVLLKLK